MAETRKDYPRLAYDGMHSTGSDESDTYRQSFSGGSGGGITVDQETQRYVDKSMEAVKAQNDGRFSEVMSSLTLIGDRLDIQKSMLIDTKNSADEAKASSASMKWNIVATALAVLGVLYASWAIWAQGIEMTTAIMATQEVSGEIAVDQPESRP